MVRQVVQAALVRLALLAGQLLLLDKVALAVLRSMFHTAAAAAVVVRLEQIQRQALAVLAVLVQLLA
jgi:hypothetical protein